MDAPSCLLTPVLPGPSCSGVKWKAGPSPPPSCTPRKRKRSGAFGPVTDTLPAIGSIGRERASPASRPLCARSVSPTVPPKCWTPLTWAMFQRKSRVTPTSLSGPTRVACRRRLIKSPAQVVGSREGSGPKPQQSPPKSPTKVSILPVMILLVRGRPNSNSPSLYVPGCRSLGEC